MTHLRRIVALGFMFGLLLFNVLQSPASFMLGANVKGGTTQVRFDGLMDERWTYSRVLSQSEIQALMNQ
jgi:hypothetical protein